MHFRKLITAALMFASVGFVYSQADRIPAGREIAVRTNESIDARSPSDSRIYSGVVDADVRDDSGRVVIPRGSEAELILRDSSRSEVTLDLECVNVNGRRYTVNSSPETVSADSRKEGLGANKRTGKYVGGGALIGTIIGAIAGGGKGAAIGAATGAGAGAVGQTVTRGGNVRVPAETLLRFRLDRPMVIGASDEGFTRNGRHYHRYPQNQDR